MRPACSSTRRCLDTAGPLIANGADSSLTVAAPEASRARIARRVGSARAARPGPGVRVIARLRKELHQLLVEERGVLRRYGVMSGARQHRADELWHELVGVGFGPADVVHLALFGQ